METHSPDGVETVTQADRALVEELAALRKADGMNAAYQVVARHRRQSTEAGAGVEAHEYGIARAADGEATCIRCGVTNRENGLAGALPCLAPTPASARETGSVAIDWTGGRAWPDLLEAVAAYWSNWEEDRAGAGTYLPEELAEASGEFATGLADHMAALSTPDARAGDIARVGDLEAALRPFAEIAEHVEHTDKRDGDIVHRQSKLGGGRAELTKQHFRAARAALQPSDAGEASRG